MDRTQLDKAIARARGGGVTMDRLVEIKTRIEATTPGTWVKIDNDVYNVNPRTGNLEWVLMAGFKGSGTNFMADVNFAANAHQDVPFLLGEIDRLTAENARLESCKGCVDDGRWIYGSDCECAFCNRRCADKWRGVEEGENA